MYEKSMFNKEKLSMRNTCYGRKILVLSVQLSVFSIMGAVPKREDNWCVWGVGETALNKGLVNSV